MWFITQDLNKMADNLQMTISKASSLIKMLDFQIKFQWNMCLRGQLTSQYSFRQWLGTYSASSHYLKQCWPRSLTLYLLLSTSKAATFTTLNSYLSIITKHSAWQLLHFSTNFNSTCLSSLSPPFLSSFSANEPSPQIVSLMGCCHHPDIYAQFYSKHCPAFSFNWFPDQNNRLKKLPGKQIKSILFFFIPYQEICYVWLGLTTRPSEQMWILWDQHTFYHSVKKFHHFSFSHFQRCWWRKLFQNHQEPSRNFEIIILIFIARTIPPDGLAVATTEFTRVFRKRLRALKSESS